MYSLADSVNVTFSYALRGAGDTRFVSLLTFALAWPIMVIPTYLNVKRGGSIWIRVFPDVPITQKPLEVRMGSGKGNVEYWVAKVLPGKVLFEIEGLSEEIAREAFRLASAKLSGSTAFVKRQVRA